LLTLHMSIFRNRELKSKGAYGGYIYYMQHWLVCQ
jgi:hypothetical protein